MVKIIIITQQQQMPVRTAAPASLDVAVCAGFQKTAKNLEAKSIPITDSEFPK